MRSRRLRGARSSPPPDPVDVNAMFAWALERGQGRHRRQYLWSVLRAARTASDLGVDRFVAVEMGVAGGNGLLALEAAADSAESLVGVSIDVVGFDAGDGMPPPKDHRDIPFLIQPGFFPMDVDALRARLARAELVLGPVGETVAAWARTEGPPVAFVAVDLDYYSSTIDALALLDAPPERLLPRVVCYFDDILGVAWSDFNGERAAIHDFNAAHEHRKIGLMHGLRWSLPATEFNEPWPEKVFLAHLFDHPRYADREGEVAAVWCDELRLTERD